MSLRSLRRALRQTPPGWLVAAIACLAILLVLGVIWYRPFGGSGFEIPPTGGPPPTAVVIEDVDLIAQYETHNLSDTSYLVETDCGCFPVTVNGSTYDYLLNIADNDTIAHNITGVAIDAPFVLLSVSPTLPYVLGADRTTTFSIEMEVPIAFGDYDLTGAVNTT